MYDKWQAMMAKVDLASSDKVAWWHGKNKNKAMAHDGLRQQDDMAQDLTNIDDKMTWQGEKTKDK